LGNGRSQHLSLGSIKVDCVPYSENLSVRFATHDSYEQESEFFVQIVPGQRHLADSGYIGARSRFGKPGMLAISNLRHDMVPS